MAPRHHHDQTMTLVVVLPVLHQKQHALHFDSECSFTAFGSLVDVRMSILTDTN